MVNATMGVCKVMLKIGIPVRAGDLSAKGNIRPGAALGLAGKGAEAGGILQRINLVPLQNVLGIELGNITSRAGRRASDQKDGTDLTALRGTNSKISRVTLADLLASSGLSGTPIELANGLATLTIDQAICLFDRQGVAKLMHQAGKEQRANIIKNAEPNTIMLIGNALLEQPKALKQYFKELEPENRLRLLAAAHESGVDGPTAKKYVADLKNAIDRELFENTAKLAKRPLGIALKSNALAQILLRQTLPPPEQAIFESEAPEDTLPMPPGIKIKRVVIENRSVEWEKTQDSIIESAPGMVKIGSKMFLIHTPERQALVDEYREIERSAAEIRKRMKAVRQSSPFDCVTEFYELSSQSIGGSGSDEYEYDLRPKYDEIRNAISDVPNFERLFQDFKARWGKHVKNMNWNDLVGSIGPSIVLSELVPKLTEGEAGPEIIADWTRD